MLRSLATYASVVIALAAMPLAGCTPSTARMPDSLSAELDAEGMVRRLDDTDLRYTHAIGTARQGWEDRRASIVVTRVRMLIHDNGDPLFQITPRSTGEYSVRREGGRVSVRGGSGQSVRSWAFHPPDDPEGWAHDIRAVIAGSAGAKRRTGD